MNKQLTALQWDALFDLNSRYIIPLYQRNYEWGKPEIDMLVSDIAEAADRETQGNYYLGSLVVFKRDNGSYEVIDGQQRLTTLNILKSVMNNSPSEYVSNLVFEHRQEADATLKNPTAESKDIAILNGFETMREAYKNLKNKEKFQEFLKEKVIILRVEVPAGTDLNHYFEIMNTRGEQLEKHEVLKVQLMSKLAAGKDQQVFAAIWDACSDMNDYVEQRFAPAMRTKLFGTELNNIPQRFDEIAGCWEVISDKTGSGNSHSIADILQRGKVDAKADNSKNGDSQFTAIIDFSNFLMHVLRIFRLTADADCQEGKHPIPLDDKNLLEWFHGLVQTPEDIKRFAVTLLKIRILFDRYIIKTDSRKGAAERWAILRLANGTNGVYVKNTFGDEQEAEKQSKLIMLQSMLQVSFGARNHKVWLQDTLQELNNKPQPGYDEYVSFFEAKAAQYWRERIESFSQLNQGTAVPHFAFNYADYCLWEKWQDKSQRSSIMPAGGRCLESSSSEMKRLEQWCHNFQFTFRSSIEHYHAQSLENIEGWECIDGQRRVDCFGNLCLVNHSTNSRLSNMAGINKRAELLKGSDNRAESFKQLLMLMYKTWNDEDMEDHQEKVLCVIQNKTGAFN